VQSILESAFQQESSSFLWVEPASAADESKLDEGDRIAAEDHDAEQGAKHGEEEPGDTSGSAKQKQKKRKKEEFVDVAAELLVLIPRAEALRQEVDKLVAAGDSQQGALRQAAQKKHELEAQMAAISAMPVCLRCWVEAPTAKARAHLQTHGIENWRYRQNRMICAHCRSLHGPHEGTSRHFDDARESLQRRVQEQLQMVEKSLPAKCSDVLQRSLRGRCKDLHVQVGSGRGRKGQKRQRAEGVQDDDKVPIGKVPIDHLTVQIHRTLERLLPEEGMKKHRSALLLGLQCLELR
jgi:hypothetical protein